MNKFWFTVRPILNLVSRHGAVFLLLIIVAVFVYSRILGHDFMTTWDDDAYVTTNEAVRGFSTAHIRQAFTNFYVGNYAPVQIISYMLDYTVWCLNPAGFHLTNILLHAGNALLLYSMMLRLGTSRQAALIAGLIFICHPVQVESVAWISQRKTLLSTFFMLVSWNCYDGWRSSNSPFRSKLLYISSLAVFVFSILTKATTVILPLILLAEGMQQSSNEKGSQNKLYPILPYILFAAVMAAITFISQSPENGGGRAPMHGGSVWTTVLTMLPVYCAYLRMLVFPNGLSAEYEVPIRITPDLTVLVSFVVLCLFLYGGRLLYRKKKLLFFWFLLFIIGFIPVSQIVPIVTPMNDRYFYLPLLGASAFFGIFLAELSECFSWKRRVVIKILTFTLIVALAGLSRQRSGVWKNGVTLWRDVVAHAPLNYEAWDSLGTSYIEASDEDQALKAYRRAVALDPDYPLVLKNIGVLYLKRGELDSALQYLTRLTGVQPNNAEAFEFLGLTLKVGGDLPGAEQALSRSLKLDPRRPSALILLAQLHVLKGDFVQAREFLLRAQKYEGPTVDNETGLATVEAGLGNTGKALSHLEMVLRARQGNVADMLKDPAFTNLRVTGQYRELLERYRVTP